MGNNYTGYGILPEDDDLEWCIDNFWDSLCDEIYSKDFLEELMQMSADVESGKEKLIPMDDVMANLKSWYEELDEEDLLK